IKFDPFMYLSLPLPSERERKMKVMVYFMDSQRKPTFYGVKVNKLGHVSELIYALSKLCGISKEKLQLIEMYNHQIYAHFKDDDILADIQDNDDLIAYEVVDEKGIDANEKVDIPAGGMDFVNAGKSDLYSERKLESKHNGINDRNQVYGSSAH